MIRKVKQDGLDDTAIIKSVAQELDLPARREFLRHVWTLGGIVLLTGCRLDGSDSVESMLKMVSRFNDKVQAALFDPSRLAPTYPESMMTRPFPFNAYYDRNSIPNIDGAGFNLAVGGLVQDKHSWTLTELNQLPQTSQVTRLICVEGWSAIGKWGGVTFSTFLQRVGADTSAKYVGLKCADDYYSSIDMPTALHAQTLLTLSYDDQVLPPEYGYPLRLRMPTKLGFKNPKHVVEIFVTNDYPGGYWEDQGYNWFSGS
ncbi:molybdopterin-dependent oxidoreductase [Pseudomonas sp. ZB1P45]|uniref:molybdopterin-dependent oxidoreductase n=1 Tax=Pseudomonas frigoris TaxID=3398356 RepID=UPI0039EF31FC